MADRSNTSTQISAPAPLTVEGDVRFHNSRLTTIVRIGWLVVVAADIVFLILSYPKWYNYLIEVMTPRNVAAMALIGVSPQGYSAWFVGNYLFLTILAYVAGVVLFLRKSDNWMIIVISLVMILFIGTTAYMYSPDIALFGINLRFPAITLIVLGVVCVYTVLFLFPDGRFYPHKWRWIYIAGMVWIVIVLYASYLIPDISRDTDGALEGTVLIVAVFALVGQVKRYREVATPVQQQQTKWILFGLCIAVVSYITIFVIDYAITPLLPDFPRAVYYMLDPVIGGLIPFSIMIAAYMFSIMRYRLWEVDIFINRGLVLGGMTLFLGTVFIIAVALIDVLARTVIGRELPAISLIASTLLIGGLYDPMHRRVRHFIDHRLYGLKFDLDKVRAKPRKDSQNDAAVETPPNWGTYEVKGLIGRGGMGNVYRGRHTTLNREVAIKMLPLGLVNDPQTRARFEQEANIVAGLRHPNIVQVFDFGEVNDTSYMVMEYIAGEQLATYIKQNAPLPLNHVRSIVSDVASALDHAHQQGFVHRDIKPSNVMLHTGTNVRGTDFPFRAILMDFGIARIVGTESGLTKTNLIGTLEYIAPEQIRAAAEVTHRADIYALGVMTYQMLTGKLPFEGGNAGVLIFAHLQKPAPNPRTIVPNIPEYVAQAVLRALEKEPEARFASAGVFAAALKK